MVKCFALAVALFAVGGPLPSRSASTSCLAPQTAVVAQSLPPTFSTESDAALPSNGSKETQEPRK